MDLIEEILISMYRFFKETQPPKSLKDYNFFYFLKNTNIFQMIYIYSRIEEKFIQHYLTFQSNKNRTPLC